MKMSFSGAPEVLAPLAHVWPRLLDPHFVARHGPGVESVEVLDPHHFKVICAFGVGSIKLRFGLDVELSNVNPPNYFAMKVRGKAPGSAVEVTADLAPEPIDADGYAALVAALRPGIDGLIVESGRHRATFLPVVWDELPDREAFVAHLWRKAGLPVGSWPRGTVGEK